LAILSKPQSIAEWAAIVTVSAGIATGLAITVEVIGKVVLLIPGTIKKIRQEGIRQGIQQGLQQSNEKRKAWLGRKEATEAAGEPFTEPSPADREPTND
jgi:hypothetical protein